MKVIFGEGDELDVEGKDLVHSILDNKAMPSQMWMNEHIRYIERFYGKVGQGLVPYYVVVTECRPEVRTVYYCPNFEKGAKHMNLKRANIAFPYKVNVLVFSAAGGVLRLDIAWPMTFYRTDPLTGLDDSLYVANMPNIRTDPFNDAGAAEAFAWTCYYGAPPNVMQYRVKKGENEVTAVAAHAKRCIDYWVQSTFNGSAMAVTAWKETAAQEKKVSSMEQWEKETKKNPMFVMKAKWLNHPKGWNLGQVIEAAKRGHMETRPEITEAKLKVALKKSGGAKQVPGAKSF